MNRPLKLWKTFADMWNEWHRQPPEVQLTPEERTALNSSRLYGYLRPTDPDDRAFLDGLVARGLLRKGAGPVKGDARCGFYWIITDAGREHLATSTKGT
jgi:hypothetical protein